MADDTHPSEPGGWLETSGLLHIFRTLGLAAQPAKLGIALAAIVATFALGGILDWFWTLRGGVGETAIVEFVAACELDQTYDEPEGNHGIFEVWREHERRCLLGLSRSLLSLPGASAAGDTPLGHCAESYAQVTPLRNLFHMAHGVWWLFRHHVCFFVFFTLGSLAIWSLAGGAICRIAAVQFAGGDQLTMTQGFAYARRKFGGFYLAPCLPVALALVVMLLMAIGGLLLRVPVVGDVIAGVAFGLAILGGFVTTVLLLALVIGGSLFWPTVAAEGADVFDAFGRGLPYVCYKPWKTVFYAVVTLIYGAICWVIVRLFTYLMLSATHVAVSFGTSPFGWFPRGDEGNPVSKLELLWPTPQGPNMLYTVPDWGKLGVFEYVSAILIAIWVLLVIGLVWSFLASFYFSASTVIYFLLRRDVDGTDLTEVYTEEDDEDAGFSETETAAVLPPAGSPAPEPTTEPPPSDDAPSPADGSPEPTGDAPKPTDDSPEPTDDSPQAPGDSPAP